jgi:hypothetical protein
MSNFQLFSSFWKMFRYFLQVRNAAGTDRCYVRNGCGGAFLFGGCYSFAMTAAGRAARTTSLITRLDMTMAQRPADIADSALNDTHIDHGKEEIFKVMMESCKPGSALRRVAASRGLLSGEG